MKIIAFLTIVFFSILTHEANSQKIYGFSDNMFCSMNLFDNSRDTLITFSDNPWINFGFRSAIDQFNGRYFFGGNLPGYSGDFHIIDLVDLSIESHWVYPDNIEYDFVRDRLIYEKNGTFYSLDLSTLHLTNLGLIGDANSSIYGQKSTFLPKTNEYFHVDFIYGSGGDPYFLIVDADSGEINCQEVIEQSNGVFYAPGGLVTNNFTGEIIGHRNGRFGVVDPCDGSMTKLSKISDYNAHLNNQMAVYNHNDNTYIIPYSSNSANDKYKYAIIDVYEDEILETRSQPWDGTLNLQQIYDRPVPPLVYLKDTLFVPIGESYEWFLNDELLGETEVNYWIPTESGTYKAHVDFREYSTHSTEYFISMTSVDETEVNQLLEVYPNPSSNLVNLEFAYCKSGIIKITDLSGQMIFKQNIKDCNSFQVNLNGLKQGFYIINVNTDKYQISNILSKL